MEESYDKPRQHIKKQRHYFATKVRLVKAMVFPVVMYGCEIYTIKKAEMGERFKKERHYFADKGPSSQSYGFSSSRVWMWELDHKEGWSEVKWKSLRCVQLFATPWTWNFLGQNTGVGSLSLLQGICPTQGSNLGLSHFRQILYQLSHKASPRILEWVASPFSSGSFQARIWTGVSFIASGLLTNWTLREAPKKAERQRIDAFKLWCWRRLLRIPWAARRTN